MEYAADANNAYKFTVTFSDKETGYTIDVLAGLATAEDCQWFLFYGTPEQEEIEYLPDALISYFVVEANSTVVLSYEPEPVVPPEPSPSPTPAPTDGDNNDRATPSYNNANCLAIMLCLVAGLMF